MGLFRKYKPADSSDLPRFRSVPKRRGRLGVEELESRVVPALPVPDHIVVVIEENHDFRQIVGNPDAPYINSLVQQGALMTNSAGVEHPSQPNYLDLFSGSNQGVTDNSHPVGAPFTTPNLGAQLFAAGRSFTGYSESMPSVGFDGDRFTTVPGQTQYERKHNPWANWVNNPVGANQFPASVNQPFTAFPTDFSQLPTISFVVPNQQNDMHDGTVAQGDAWLRNNLDAYVQWAQKNNSLLIVTFDENDFSPGNRISTFFVGPMVKSGFTDAQPVNHFNVLRTLEDIYGLPTAGASAAAAPIAGVWGVTAPTIAGSPQSGLLLSVPAVGPAVVSGVANDPTDPASTRGLIFTIADAESAPANLVVTAVSSNTAVVDNTAVALSISGTGATRTLKIKPNGVGYADITVTVTDGTNLSSTYIVKYAASASSVNPALSRYFVGAADASTAIAVDNDYMFVADDENQVLRLYNRNQSGLPVKSFDVTGSLGITQIDNDTGLLREVDIEASTRVGNRLYWMGSMSNGGSNANNRPNRNRVFATDLAGTGADASLTFVGHYDNLRQDLINWDNARNALGAPSYGLATSAGAGIFPEASDGSGFNLEGLTMAPGSTTTAYLGFRAPLTPVGPRNRALIVPITNFPALFTGGTPSFGEPIELDLTTPDGNTPRGIRSMESNGSQILIVAGPASTTAGVLNPFKLFTWDGIAANAPVAQRMDLNGYNPEAIVAVPVGTLSNTSVIQLLSDTGDTVYYGDGIAAKALPEVNFRKSQGDLVALGGLGGNNSTVDLSVSIDNGINTANVGSAVSYSVTVTNNDFHKTLSKISLNLAPLSALSGVTFTPSRGTYDNTTGIWDFTGGPLLTFVFPFLPNSATMTVSGTIKPSGAGNLNMTAAVDLAPSDKIDYVDIISTNNLATDATTVGTLNQRYVAAVYISLLKRTVDDAGMVFWSGRLDAGEARGSIAALLTRSAEYFRTNVIIPSYKQFLNRDADQTGLDYWTAQLQGGITDEQMQAGFIASSEFYNNVNGGPVAVTPAHDRVWVGALYVSLLGRGPDQAGEDYWTGNLQGIMTRLQVANGFTGSTEGLSVRIQQTYVRYLGRGADPGGLAFWLSRYAQGAVNEDIVTGFIASDEYFKEATK